MIDVLAVEQAVLALDVVELDGEAVGGGAEFVLGQQQRRGAALLAPPAEDRPRRRPVRAGVTR